jgi:hypothetical protein
MKWCAVLPMHVQCIIQFWQENACFCMAAAHFYAPCLEYSNPFMTILAEEWQDVFVEGSDASSDDKGVPLEGKPL